MKKGCLFLLAIFAASWIGYRHYLQSTELADKWWVPGLLALSLLLLLTNLWGIVIAVRQKIASGKSPSDWRDGALVGLSGAISTARPIKAPFSGKSAAIVEYEISKVVDSSESQSRTKECMGFMMAPTTIQGMRGSVRLVGFPLLAQMKDSSPDDETAYRNAAEFLLKTTFKPEPKNPLKILAEINAVLGDDDGVVDAHMGNVTLRDSVLAGTSDSDDLDSSDDDLEEEHRSSSERDSEVAADPDLVTKLAEKLSTRSYDLNEKAIEPGTTVTVFGTYQASKQAIDIGSGLKNLSHTLQLGPIDKVISRNFRRSFFGTIFWGAVAAGGHYYVGKLVGLIH